MPQGARQARSQTRSQHTSDAELYPDGPCEGGDAQWCNDAVVHRPTGAITQPPIHWIDRPTFQQVVQIGK